MVKPTISVGPTSIWARKLDLFYIVFLSVSIFMSFAFDIALLVPSPHLLPSWATSIHDYYIATYNDPIFVLNPPWLQLTVWLEVFVLIPLEVIGVRGLVKDDKTTPLYLLIWGLQYTITTAVCLVELLWAKDWPAKDIAACVPGYVIFMGISAGIMVDMFLRLRKMLIQNSKDGQKGKSG